MKSLCSLFLIVALLSVGCGKSGPKLIPATGSVTVKGQPAGGVFILFHPSDIKQATASAVTEADGTFKLSSNGEPGILEGKYQVTLTWPDPSKKPTEAQIMMGTAEPGPDLLKGKYATKTASTLSAEITANSVKLPPFELP